MKKIIDSEKKNCMNCRHLEWADGDIGDPEGFVCTKKDLYGADESRMISKMDRKSYRLKSKSCFVMEKRDYCFDADGNKVKAGDKVKYYPLVDCMGQGKEGEVWCVADMNEKQVNMPFIRGVGVWSPDALRKII